MKKKVIIIISLCAILLVAIIKGLQWKQIGLFDRELTTEEDYADDYPRAEDGRRYTSSGKYSSIKPDRIEFYVKGTLTKGSLEFVFVDDETGEEYVRKVFSEKGEVDFLESTKKSAQDIEMTVFFSDDAVFVGEAGVNMFAHDYKTWFKAY